MPIEFERSKPIEVKVDGETIHVRPLSLAEALAAAKLGGELESAIQTQDASVLERGLRELTDVVADASDKPEALRSFASANADMRYFAMLSQLIGELTGAGATGAE